MVFIFLNACQAAKDGLTQKKRSNADEFLVEKKNPLVLPPSFDDLPTPDDSKIKQQNNNKTSDIKNLLTKDGSSASQSSKTTGSSDIENFSYGEGILNIDTGLKFGIINRKVTV